MLWRRAVLATLSVCLATLMLLGCLIDREGVRARPTPRVEGQRQIVVVLGARVEADGQPSETLRRRVEHGVNVLASSPHALILFSGGVGDFGPSEASVARRLAMQLGVPAERCLTEEESHSTRQNAARSLELLRERFPEGFNITLVSDPYHLPRARMLFQRLGGRVVGTSPALEVPRHLAWSSRAWWTLREIPAWTKDLM